MRWQATPRPAQSRPAPHGQIQPGHRQRRSRHAQPRCPFGARQRLGQHAAGRQKGVRLIEAVRRDMQHGGGKRAQPAFQQHEAHLRDSGVGQCCLDGTLRAHCRRAEQGRDAAYGHQQRHRSGGQRHHARKPQHQKPACVDHARMQQGRDRGGGLHHLQQPAMQRELRRFQDRRSGQQHGGHPCAVAVPRHGHVHTAAVPPQQRHRRDQAGITRPADQKFLARRQHGSGPPRIEQQQPVQPYAHTHPRQRHLRQVARHCQQRHGGQSQAQPPHEPCLSGVACQIGRAEAHDHQPDKPNQHGKHR